MSSMRWFSLLSSLRGRVLHRRCRLLSQLHFSFRTSCIWWGQIFSSVCLPITHSKRPWAITTLWQPRPVFSLPRFSLLLFKEAVLAPVCLLLCGFFRRRAAPVTVLTVLPIGEVLIQNADEAFPLLDLQMFRCSIAIHHQSTAIWYGVSRGGFVQVGFTEFYSGNEVPGTHSAPA